MAKINIKGPIVSSSVKWVYDWFGMEATSPQDVSSQIDSANGEDLEVEINSGGGDVFAGSEIYTSLKDYQGKIIVKVVGIAASAASVIAMAGHVVKISPTAQIMIHNVSSYAEGDYRNMQHEADVLKNYNKSIANAYILKTGMSQEALLELMNQETWLNAQQAKENGFADEVMFDEGNQLVASFGGSMLLPPEVINKVRNLIKQQPSNIESPNLEDQAAILMRNKAQAKLNLLKLGGRNYE
ncbi:MAG: Clp protease ClpP [Bacillota bacterium]|nr:Clp protease ClpP [Bacillota bacterium]